ncbi:MAG: prepilin peptidase [Gemmobacter sp.]|nr:prepilin peptidase [Gemmobacter sp.]
MITIPALVGIVVFGTAMVWAAVSDAATRTIPNCISILMLAGYCLLAPLAGFSLRDMGASAGAAGLVGIVLVVFFARGWIGGGDAKLITATTLWLGPDQLLNFLLWTSVVGGLLAVAALAFRGVPMNTAGAMPVWVSRTLGRSGGIPFALAIAPAGLARLYFSSWMIPVH